MFRTNLEQNLLACLEQNNQQKLGLFAGPNLFIVNWDQQKDFTKQFNTLVTLLASFEGSKVQKKISRDPTIGYPSSKVWARSQR